MCSSSDKFGHATIWIIMTWIKHHYKASMSEPPPELPHKLLNTWAWVRWSFGAGLWCCSALTVTEMEQNGQKHCKFYPWGREGRVEHRRVAVHSSRHARHHHTSHSHPPSVSCKEEMHQEYPNILHLESVQLLERCCVGQKQGNINKPTLLVAQRLPSGYLSREQWGSMCISRARGETN